MALPSGGQVVVGDVTVNTAGARMTLNQGSRTAIMNWNQFNIGTGETVRLRQSGADAAMLARVTGGDPTRLLGRLQADGSLFLINSKGVVVGQGAVIDTAAFLASTLDVSDGAFLKQGALTFKGDSDAGVVNLGQITAREGNLLLLAHTVKNAGELAAPRGTVGLGAGSQVFLASPDAPNFVVKARLPGASVSSGETGVDNSGVIAAAQAQLEAAGGSLYDLAINHTGLIHATGVERRPDGRVLLTAGGGTVAVKGTVIAEAADGSGGEILVGGDFQGKNTAVANASRTLIGKRARLEASATSATGDGGRVIVWSDERTEFRGTAAARAGEAGGDGGFAEISGKRTLAFRPAEVVDLSAPAGARGTLLLDPADIVIGAAADPGTDTLAAADLAAQLLTADVNILADDSITVNAPLVVAPGGTAGTHLYLAAPSITVNATVSLANVTDGRLTFFSRTMLTSAATALISSDFLRVVSDLVTLNGPVEAGRLDYGQLGEATSFIATHPGNAISTLVLGDPLDATVMPVDFVGSVHVHSGTAMEVNAFIASATHVTLSSAGNLTLSDHELAQSVITASGTTTLASTGGVFINQAGADVLAGSGRRVLYTSSTGGAFTLGGLTGYSQFDGVNYPADPQSTVTLVLYNAEGGGPVLTLRITAADFTRIYGQGLPSFSAIYSGGTAADLTTLPSFSILEGTAVNVGTYTIVPSGAASATHAIEYVNGTFTITPATLTYIANAANRVYGDGNPTFGGTVTGFVNGDTILTATTGSMTFGSGAIAGTNVGQHAILGSGLVANHGNYVFEQATGNYSALTITPAPLTISFADAMRVYGQANRDFTATFTGFRNGDGVGVLSNYNPGTTAHLQSPVGTYLIASGATAHNYTITVEPGTLTITPAALHYTISDIERLYAGSNRGFNFSVTGVLPWDNASVAGTPDYFTSAVLTSNVGAYPINATFSGVGSNYTVGSVDAGTLTINPAPLTLAAANLSVFYGSPRPSPAYSVTGFRLGQGPELLTGVTFDPLVSPLALPGSYAITFASTGAAPNYVVSNVVPGTLTIARRPIEIRAHDAMLGGIVPTSASFSYTANPPPPGGLPFSIVIESPVNHASEAGTYDIVPVIVPGAGLTLEDLAVAYDFSVTPGRLVYTPLKLDFTYDPETFRKNTTAPDFIDEEALKNAGRISIYVSQNGELSPAALGSAVKDFGPELRGIIVEMFADGGFPISLTEEAKAQLKAFADGRLSVDGIASLVASDADFRAAIMPVLAKATMDAVLSGRPLSPNAHAFVARIAENVNKQRKLLAAELEKQRLAFLLEKAETGQNNIYALKTMPDIAITAQQAAAEQLVGAAIGAGVGLGVGGSLVGIVAIEGVAAAIFPNAGVGAGVSATSVATGAAAGIVTVAVALVVVGVVAGVMVAQEKDNINAYDAAVARSKVKVGSSLGALDLKNNDLAKTEFFTAFVATMLETGLAK